MKRIISIIMTLSVLFVFTACDAESPADTTKVFLDSIKTQNGENLQAFMYTAEVLLMTCFRKQMKAFWEKLKQKHWIKC